MSDTAHPHRLHGRRVFYALITLAGLIAGTVAGLHGWVAVAAAALLATTGWAAVFGREA